jgi:hypothetical protein
MGGFRGPQIGHVNFTRGLAQAKGSGTRFRPFPVNLFFDKMVCRDQRTVSIQGIIAQLHSLGRRRRKSITTGCRVAPFVEIEHSTLALWVIGNRLLLAEV